jgi:hypothetical protein
VPGRRARHDRPPWSAITTVIQGELPHGAFDVSQVPEHQSSPLRSCGFFEVVAHGVDFDLDRLHLGVAWSDFDQCIFRQRLRKSYDGVWPQGNLGARPSTYSHCRFEGVRFRLRAGFSVGRARFEDCTFRQCRFEEHFSFCADYVRCTFEGPIRTAVFYGRAPDGHDCDGKLNEIVSNDFTGASIGDNVGWRGDLDLSAQKWPAGYRPFLS